MAYLFLAALVFGACFLVDKGFSRLFRGRKEHRSGLSVKHNKRAALFGLVLAVLGIAGILAGIGSSLGLLILSVVVLLMAAALIVYYLSFGIYYDAEGKILYDTENGTPVRAQDSNGNYKTEDYKEEDLLKIEQNIELLASQITDGDFKDFEEPPVLLCVLNGSIMFMAELMQRLNFNCQIVSTKLTSYEGTATTGKVKQAMGLTSSIEGRRVIVVEDIVDSGNTIVELKEILKDKGASESKICTLLLKPDAYKKDIKIDYVAMEIPNDFIVGFGLDYDELGRNYKDIYTLDA